MPGQSGGSNRGEEVEALVRRLEPRIIAIFRQHTVSPSAAVVILEEVVTLLLYRWGQIARPEAWLIEMLQTQARRKAAPPDPETLTADEPRSPG